MSQADRLVSEGDEALERGDREAAEAAYRAALDIDLDHAEALHSLGYIEISRNNYPTARILLEKALARDPDHRGAQQLLANAHLGMKDFAAAKRAFLAVKGNSPQPIVLAQLGLCCEGEGNWIEAEDWLRQALENDLSYITRYSVTGVFLYGPFPADLHHALARVLQRQGRCYEARLHYHLTKRNDATTELDPMYLEIMTEADLENHPSFDVSALPAEGADAGDPKAWFVRLLRIDNWNRLVEAAAGMERDMLDRLGEMIHGLQAIGMFYLSAKLRLVGDAATSRDGARATFEALTSYHWRRFFETAELTMAGRIAADEARVRLARTDLDARTAPLLADLVERFVRIALDTGVPLADCFRVLTEDRDDPVLRAEGARLQATAAQASGRLQAACDALRSIDTAALPTDVRIRFLDRSWSILAESGNPEEAKAALDALIASAHDQGLPDLLAYALGQRAQLVLSQGCAAEARADCESALALGKDALKGSAGEVLAEAMKAVSAQDGRPFVRGPVTETQATAGTRSFQIDYDVIRAMIDAGRTEEALTAIEVFIEDGFTEGARAAAAFGLVMKAKLLAREGRFDEADDAVRRGIFVGTPEGRRFDRLEALILASRIAKKIGHHDEARKHAEGAVSAARDLEDSNALGETLRHLSFLLTDSDIDRAVSLLGESLNCTRKADGVWRAANAAELTGRAEDALAIYRRLATSDAEDDRRNRGFALNNAAIVRMNMGDREGAIADMDASIEAFLEARNDSVAAGAMERAVHLRRRFATPHSDILDRLIGFAEDQTEPFLRREIGITAGRAAFYCGLLDKAETLLSSALKIAISEDWGDDRDALTAGELLGQICRTTGRYREGLAHYNRALPLAQRLADPDAEATVRGNRAVALRHLDRIDEALSDYEAAIAIFERRQNKKAVARIRLNMAQSLHFVGRNKLAIEAALSAYEHFNATGSTCEADRALVFIDEAGRYDMITRHLRPELDALAERGRSSEEPLIRNWAETRHAYRISARKGRRLEAEAILREVARRQSAARDHYGTAMTWLNLADMLSANGKTAEALKAAEAAAGIAEQIDQMTLQTRAAESLCRIRLAAGNLAEATALLGRIERRWAERRGRLTREVDRVFVADRAAHLIDDIAAAHLERGNLGAALEVIDRGRAPALLDLPGETAGVPLGVAEMAALAGQLGPDTTLVALAWIDWTLSAFTLRPGEAAPEVHETGLERDDIEEMLANFERDVLRYRGEGPMIWARTAGRIFDAIVHRLPQDGTVILLTEEELAPLPLEAVPLADGRRLIDRAAVIYAPSMRFLARAAACTGTEDTQMEFAAVGVAFQNEVLAILQRHLVPGATSGMTGNRLDPEDILQSVAKARIVHFACHGLFDQQNHLDSGLVLTINQDVMSRDVLTVRMISSTRVAAELVVLSACASGLGVASASDFLGLGRAWLAAGARGTVTALWNIENSATQALMLDFYRRLSDDNGGFRNAAQALRGAQRDAAKRSSFYQWAAFRYTGWPLLHLPEGTHT